MVSIAKTDEWRAIIVQLREELDRKKEAVLYNAGRGESTDKAWGQYDGYRQAIEKFESFGEGE